jgi:NAD(P)-dependent dehydrogenase (short-subunit alcohol dehydrogenase family)
VTRVLVTGGSRGTGAAIVRTLHRDGATVASARSADSAWTTPPQEVAEVIALLASGRSRQSTGATIDIAGADHVR